MALSRSQTNGDVPLLRLKLAKLLVKSIPRTNGWAANTNPRLAYSGQVNLEARSSIEEYGRSISILTAPNVGYFGDLSSVDLGRRRCARPEHRGLLERRLEL